MPNNQSLDIRCETDYSSKNKIHRPGPHMHDNATGYYFTQTQRESGFFEKIQKRNPKDSLVVVFGGARTPLPIDPKIRQLNIDFDSEAFEPRVLVDLNNLPSELYAKPGETLDVAFDRCMQQISGPVREKIAAMSDLLKDEKVGSCVFSMVLQYLQANVRSRLLTLCLAGIEEGGSVYVGERHLIHFTENGFSESVGFEEARGVAALWGDAVQTREYYRAPELTPKLRDKISKSSSPGQVFALLQGLPYADVSFQPEHDRVVNVAHPDAKKNKAGVTLGVLMGHHVLEIKKQKQ